MFCSSRDVAALSGPEQVRFPIQRERHFSAQNNVRCLIGIRVFGIVCVRPIGPHISVQEALLLQFRREFSFIQHLSRPFPPKIPPLNGFAPNSPCTGGKGKRGRAVFRREDRFQKLEGGAASEEGGGSIFPCLIILIDPFPSLTV